MPFFTHLCKKVSITMEGNRLSLHPTETYLMSRSYDREFNLHILSVKFFPFPEARILFQKHYEDTLFETLVSPKMNLDQLPKPGYLSTDDPRYEHYHLTFDTVINDAMLETLLSVFERNNLISPDEKQQMLLVYRSLEDAILMSEPTKIAIPKILFHLGDSGFFSKSTPASRKEDFCPQELPTPLA
jgi:hypothetical protein